MFGLAKDMTTPYSAVESWTYDRYVAPAVDALAWEAAGEFLAQLPQGAKVLDIGCGGGHNLLAIAKRRPDLELTGLDLCPQQIARARKRAKEAAARIELVEGSALDLPFGAASFDGVVSIASIKHWPEPARGLREAIRVLKPGGGLLVAEADRGCRYEDARDFVARFRTPKAALPMVLALFRTYVAGRSFDLAEANALLEDLPLEEKRAERVAGTPAWLIGGKVAAS